MLPKNEQRERGSASVIIVGFAVVLMMTIAVVVDASAAFLQRQSLATLAEGAALSGADAGAEGGEVYSGGLSDQPLQLTQAQARAGVGAYLAAVGAGRDFPGLAYDVDVRNDQVIVTIRAPLDLPLTFPGSPLTTTISASSTAIVDPE